MRRFYLLMLFCAVLIFKSNLVNAQEKPIWLDGYYDETSVSYLKVVQGTSKNSYEFARKNAMMQVIKDNFLESDVELKMYGDMFDIRTDNNVKVKARVIAEYQEKIEYDYICHLLVQVMKNPNDEFEKVAITDKYPFSARVLVPGMAQMYKGQKTKGLCFIAGEVALVGGAIVSHTLMVSNINKISSTHNSTLKAHYTRNANACMAVRNISIAGAAALYLWNIIDGAAAKGDEHIMLGNNELIITPYSDINSTGIALNLKF